MRSNPTRASFQGAGKCNARPLPPRPAQPLPKPDHSRLAWRCLCRKLKADVPPTARRSQYTRPASRFKWLAGATGDRTPTRRPAPKACAPAGRGRFASLFPFPEGKSEAGLLARGGALRKLRLPSPKRGETPSEAAQRAQAPLSMRPQPSAQAHPARTASAARQRWHRRC